MDSFLGSGSTIATAHKWERKWVESNLETMPIHCVRFAWIMSPNGDKTGISKSYHWEGSSGYHF
ncbi:MAG: hypothetical protein ACLUOO_03100 [Coprococcus sp.]